MLLRNRTTRNLALLSCVIGIIILAANSVFAADPGDLTPFAAALAVGITGAAASIGMAIVGSSAVGAITERPEIFGKTFLFIVLIEAVAIYGLLVAIILALG